MHHCFPDIILKHYVDDFLLIDVAPPSSSHRGHPFELLLRVVKQFGWTIHPTKQFSWTRRFTFLGIDWDLDAKTASLTSQKQRKFMRKLEHAYNPSSTLSEKEIASIIGSCQHTCVLTTTRRSKLNALYSLRNTFRGQHKAAKKHLPTAARAEVRSWLEFFQQGPVTCSLSFPTHLHPTPLYTDASDFGLGIVFGDHAITIPLPADYTARPGINIGVGEAWAFELGVYAAIQHGAVNCILTTYVDNLGVVHAARRGRSRNTLANEAIDRAADAALAANVDLSIIYVPSAENLSDAPSRGDSSTPQRHELTDQAAQSRQHALTIIGSLSVADTSSGSALTPAEVWNSLSADNTPTCSLTGKKADDLGREHVLVELSPAEHLVAAIHGSLPLHTIQQLRQFRSHRVKLDTRKSYGGHVVAFLRWADDLDIPQHMRFPIPPTIVLLYISSAAPFYAANTLSKMVSGLQAWHAVHALPWALDRVEARMLRQALANLALPPLDLRRPVRLADFEAMQRHMAVADRAHTAVYTCALFSLWSMARHGELTVDVVSRPHDSRPRRSDIRMATGEQGQIKSVIVYLPEDKTHGNTGFNRVVSTQSQDPRMCPVAALQHHLQQSPVPSSCGVFAYIDKHGQPRELGASFFIKTINRWLAADGAEPITGHSFRIGGATLLHSNGLPIEFIKHLGGWASDAALRYIQDIHVHHAEVCSDLDLAALRSSPCHSGLHLRHVSSFLRLLLLSCFPLLSPLASFDLCPPFVRHAARQRVMVLRPRARGCHPTDGRAASLALEDRTTDYPAGVLSVRTHRHTKVTLVLLLSS
ncbi:hypothetical protein CF328_g4300 [Tilletia controversa]|nr:hypothetical protein CF328_g4300 [Tilletia controversa]